MTDEPLEAAVDLVGKARDAGHTPTLSDLQPIPVWLWGPVSQAVNADTATEAFEILAAAEPPAEPAPADEPLTDTTPDADSIFDALMGKPKFSLGDE